MTASQSVVSWLDGWTRDALLRDGSVAQIRPLDPADAAAGREFYSRLSQRTLYLGFGNHPGPLVRDIQPFLAVDHTDRMAFVVEHRGSIIGIGRYDRVDPTSAEIAFVVSDDIQGHGVGTLLLEYLSAFALTQDIGRFIAATAPDNTPMLNVLRSAGFEQRSSTGDGLTRVVMELTPTVSQRKRVDELEWQTDARSLGPILAPRGIAVFGASLSGTGIGNLILSNIQAGGYAGQVAAVNPKVGGQSSGGQPSGGASSGGQSTGDDVAWLPTLRDCPFPVDLAIVVVPAAIVPAVVRACADADVRGMVIISSGFAEAGPEGGRLQDEVMVAAHRVGIRVIGPNCLGIVNAAPGVSLNATFAGGTGGIQSGHIALASQSGAVGIALLERTRQLDLGVSAFVSMGNKADVSGNNLLRYWHQDATTRVILLYIESFGNPGKFFDIARVVGRSKPIVVVKGGRSAVGARAAASHTASMASSDRAADALFAQAGVIRAATLDEMLGLGSLLDHSPIPRGDRIVIISNAGGAGVLAADTAEDVDLSVAPLPQAVQDSLRAHIPGVAAVENPVDTGAGVTSAIYGAALGIVAQCRDIDAIVAIHTPVPQLTTAAFVDLTAEVAAQVDIPVVAVTLGVDPRGHASVARFAFPETAVRTLARVVAHSRWRQSTIAETARPIDVARGPAHHLVQVAFEDAPAGRWLHPQECARLLECYGVPQETARFVRTTKDAIASAREVGLPVAIKADVSDLLHKTDAGAVVLNVRSLGGVESTMRDFRDRFGSRLRGVMVQRMVATGVELIAGAVRDPKFGPLVLYGSGGTNAELFGDQLVRLAPLTDREATALVLAPRGARLLEGYRGRPACDVAAIADVLRRISQLAFDIPEIAEIECNPLVASPNGAVAVDVRVRVEAVPDYAPSWLRSIRSDRDRG